MKLKGLDKILLMSAKSTSSQNKTNIGNLTDLETTDKTNLVDAVNEVMSLIYPNRESIIDPITTLQYRWTLQVSNGVPFMYLTDVAYDPTWVLDDTIVDIVTGIEYRWSFAVTNGELSIFLEEVI